MTSAIEHVVICFVLQIMSLWSSGTWGHVSFTLNTTVSLLNLMQFWHIRAKSDYFLCCFSNTGKCWDVLAWGWVISWGMKEQGRKVTNSDKRFELCHMNYHKITHHNVKPYHFSYCSAGSYFSNIYDWYFSQSSFINGCSSVVPYVSDTQLQLILKSISSKNARYNTLKIWGFHNRNYENEWMFSMML